MDWRRERREKFLVGIRSGLIGACFLALGLQLSAPAQASLDTPAKQLFIMDDRTGAVLAEKEGFAAMPPASMSKLMTIYLLFDRLASGSLKLDDTFVVSEKAWRMGGSKMFVHVGDRVKIEDLIRGIIVQSGNDACIVIAEGLAGSEESFAVLMNKKAKEIGLNDSKFANSTGWPDPNQLMSPRDLAMLAHHLIHNFQPYYHYFSETNFTYNGIRQGNRNPLIYKEVGADGLKTGHTEDSGYGIVISGVRGDRRVTVIANGLESVNQRSREAERLLDWGFREFNNYVIAKAGQSVADAEVWLGQEATIPLVAKDELVVTLPRSKRDEMKATIVYDGPIPAPILQGAAIAKMVVSAPDVAPVEIPLYAGKSVDRLGFVGRLFAAIGHLVWGGAARH